MTISYEFISVKKFFFGVIKNNNKSKFKDATSFI